MTSSPAFRASFRLARTAFAAFGIAALLGSSQAVAASAKAGRDGNREQAIQSRAAGPPVLAVVSLSRQRVTIYDSEGWILRSPVSTGQTGYETPAGVYSILQKKVEHTSNLYDDASMPFMQRITWSGIALHAGALPGHPASHGCIRMPLSFAEQLFEVTRLGMRVVVMREDIGPADISHPLLFKPGLAQQPEVVATNAASPVSLEAAPPAATAGQNPKAVAAQKAADAAGMGAKAQEARMAAAKQSKEAARAVKAFRLAQGGKLRAEAQLRAMETQWAMASAPEAMQRAEEAKAQLTAKVAEAQALAEELEAELQPIQDAAQRLREEAQAAEQARTAAEEQAKEAARRLLPIAVFISRKTQRLYVRQAREPLFDMPVTIANAAEPLGTYVFTALPSVGDETDLRWRGVSLYSGTPGPGPSKVQRHKVPDAAEALATDVDAARSALDRIAIPKEAMQRISEVVSPGSSLIVSDEEVSRETGAGTEFVIVMGTEPQGGITIRKRRDPATFRERFERPIGRSPYGSSYGWGPSFW
jgi:L,D-transpeptidase catalytic domain